MQVENLFIKNNTEKKTDITADFISENNEGDSSKVNKAGTNIAPVKVEKGDKVQQSPVYNKTEIKKASEAYEIQVKSASEEKNQQNEMILAAHTMSKQDYKEMLENGFDPADTDSKTFVTIADKIRIQMAKAGKDMSITGKVSDAAIKAVAGSAAEANSIESAVKKSSGELADVTAQTIENLAQADLPVNSDTKSQINEMAAKTKELPDTITSETSAYLIKNELDPTVDNVVKAAFAGNTDVSGDATISDSDISQLLPQIQKIIEDAGLTADETQVSNAVFMLKNNVPLTSENIKLFNDLNGRETLDISGLPQAVTDAVMEGKNVTDVMAVSGFSAIDKARDAMQTVSTATGDDVARVVSEDKPLTIANLRVSENKSQKNQPESADEQTALKIVKAQRQLEETRLYMTTEANFSLIKRGVAIDTTELSDLVEQLKAQEKTLGQALFPDDITKAALFDDTTDILESAKQAPAAIISSHRTLDGVLSSNLTEIASENTKQTRYEKAEKLYEKLSVSPSEKYGDDINKAFSNVDEILEDNGLDTDDENRRAVRILAYNNRDINADSIKEVREADEKVQKVFNNMTPGVVMKMVKHGENPLKLSMDELYNKMEDIKKVVASSGSETDKDAQDYADFLWKAQQSGQVSDDEKQSYIGLYRLMYQIDKTDGAPIGALLAQGTDVTMENLMMAVRSEKYVGHDYIIDDNFEAPDSKITNSITEQISTAYRGRWAEILSERQQSEKEFQTRRTRDAKALAIPERLQAIGGEKAYMPMSPDRLASALEAESSNSDESETDEQLYQAKQAEIERAVEEADQRTYQILNDAGVADSAINLTAVNQIIKNHRFFYTKLYGENGRQPFDVMSDNMAAGDGMTLDDAWDKVISDFEEALKSPQEMAEAQKELYDTAENVLRKSLADDAAAGKIDIRLIQQSVRQLSVMKELSQKKEEYAIPVMVGDELGNMNLKIVRGKDEKKGLIDIAMDSDTTGEVYARFKASEDGGIDGKITTNRRTSRETLSENLGMLAEKIQEKLGQGSVSLVTEYDGRTDASAVFYNTDDPGFETTDDKTNEIQTKTLYAISRSFVETIGELFQ